MHLTVDNAQSFHLQDSADKQHPSQTTPDVPGQGQSPPRPRGRQALYLQARRGTGHRGQTLLPSTGTVASTMAWLRLRGCLGQPRPQEDPWVPEPQQLSGSAHTGKGPHGHHHWLCLLWKAGHPLAYLDTGEAHTQMRSVFPPKSAAHG